MQGKLWPSPGASHLADVDFELRLGISECLMQIDGNEYDRYTSNTELAMQLEVDKAGDETNVTKSREKVLRFDCSRGRKVEQHWRCPGFFPRQPACAATATTAPPPTLPLLYIICDWAPRTHLPLPPASVLACHIRARLFPRSTNHSLMSLPLPVNTCH
jgi:hypothetical protein